MTKESQEIFWCAAMAASMLSLWYLVKRREAAVARGNKPHVSNIIIIMLLALATVESLRRITVLYSHSNVLTTVSFWTFGVLEGGIVLAGILMVLHDVTSKD